MSLTERMFRLVVAVVLVAGFLPIQAARAAPIYTWDRGANTNVWPTANNWDVGGANPLTAPGSNYSGVATDDVRIDRIGTNATVYLRTDAGTIDTLYIQPTGGLVNLNLDNAASALTVTSNVYMGYDQAGTMRPGNLIVGNNNDADMTINGSIYSTGTADNDLTLNCPGGAFTLAGNIDPAATATYQNRIDLTVARGTFTWNGTEMNIQEFNLFSVGGSNEVGTWTLGTGQTLTTTARSDVGQNTSGAGAGGFTTNGTLNIYGGTYLYTGSGEALGMGNVVNDPTAGTTTAIGTINVGDIAEPAQVSTLTLAGELKMAPLQADGAAGTQVGQATLNVYNAGSTVTLNGGVEFAANAPTAGPQEISGASFATINIYDGLVTIYQHLENGNNTCNLNLEGGRLHLATPTVFTAPGASQGNLPRGVDNFTMRDGATLQMTLTGEALPMTVDFSADLDAGLTGLTNARIDLRNAPADSMVDTNYSVEWVGGTGDWAVAANWNPGVLPSQACAVLVSGVTKMTLIDSLVAITNIGNATLVGPEAANWTLDTTDATKLRADYVGTSTGFGPGTATLSDAADIVGRTTDLLVGKVVGLGFDAAALEIYDGSLTLDDPLNIAEPNLTIEGDTGTTRTDQDVLVAGGALTINGDLDFGSVVGSGGTFRTTGGTTHVLGNVTAAGTAAQLYVDGGTLTVDGDIATKSFRTGDAVGSVGTYTVPNGQTLTTSGYLQPGRYGDGTLILENGSTVNVGSGFRIAEFAGSVGAVIMNGGDLNVLSTASDVGLNGAGALEIRAGTATLTGGEISVGCNAGSTGTVKVGEFGGNPTVHALQTEIGEDGGNVTPSTFEMWSGTWYFESGNFVQGQADGTQSTVTLHGGTIDLTGSTTGQWNINKGTHTTDILGGLVKIGGAMQFTFTAGSSEIFTIGGGEVRVGGSINYRDDGTDTLNLKSGILDLLGGNINPAGATGTNAFNWTGGTLKNVATFTGDLTQDDTDSASLLVIGASAGTTSVTGNYTLSGGEVEFELLVDPATGTAGVDWDLLNVTGTAAFNSGGTINLDLGTYTAQLNDTWGIVAATTITSDYASIADLFDTTSADPGAGLSWDFSQFTTDGSVKVVPEPATLALLGLGAAASFVLRRRRQA